MKWFLDISTRNKLFIGFGLMIALLVLVASIAWNNVTRIQYSEKKLYDQEFADVLDIINIRAHQYALRSDILAIMLTSNNAIKKDVFMNDINLRGKAIEIMLQKLVSRNKNNPERLSMLEKFEDIQKDFSNTRETQTIPLLNAGKIDEAKQLILGIQSERNTKMQAIADEIVNLTEQNARSAMEQSVNMTQKAVHTFFILGLLAILFGITMTLMLTKILAGPLGDISNTAQLIAKGDLSVNLPEHNRTDETGMLIKSFSQMVASFRDMMGKINEGINVLASSATEITASTTQVVAGSTETAAAINETTATIEEVKQTSDVSVQKAKYVLGVAQKTMEISSKGKQSMEESIDAMHRIQKQMEFIAESIIRLSEQSKDIGEIIATVNDLAEQSNLLAVNAAIEAAKAGEHGKGFAVVAQEVKSLAAQSKQATAQVRSILSEIQNATSNAVIATEQGNKVVEDGVKRSIEASESIVTLTESITESAQAASQIMSSAQQQLAGMDQVAIAMQNINQASTQNLASTKQAEITAKDLQGLGRRLKLLTEQYRL